MAYRGCVISTCIRVGVRTEYPIKYAPMLKTPAPTKAIVRCFGSLSRIPIITNKGQRSMPLPDVYVATTAAPIDTIDQNRLIGRSVLADHHSVSIDKATAIWLIYHCNKKVLRRTCTWMAEAINTPIAAPRTSRNTAGISVALFS